jgi:acetolactate synthase-1/2/3 large subunit
MDYRFVFGSSAKAVIELDAAERIPELVARAWTIAHADRPGPVVIVAPEDVLDAPVSASPVTLPRVSHPAVAARELDELSDRLARAERPLVIVGGCGWDATLSARFAERAAQTMVPIAAAFRWQSVIDNRAPAYVGYLGLGCSATLRAAARRSDLVVALGPRLDDPTTDGYALTDELGPDRLVLVGDASAQHVFPAGTVLSGSISSAVHCLLERELTKADRSGWYETLVAAHQSYRSAPTAASSPVLDLAETVRETRRQLPDDAVVTTGAGNYTVWVQRYFEFRQFQTQLAPRNGAMGYGVPAAMAAAALDPTRPVVAFAGDGCFLMSGSELATMVKHELPVVVVVVNNQMFGTIRMHQERRYPGRAVATDLTNPDFAAYAASFGVPAHVVCATAEYPAALRESLASGGPALIELRVDPLQLTPDVRLESA